MQANKIHVLVVITKASSFDLIKRTKDLMIENTVSRLKTLKGETLRVLLLFSDDEIWNNVIKSKYAS